MQAKVFLSYILATILAVGVIATPVDVADAEATTPPDVNNMFEETVDTFATFNGPPDPVPTGPTITPKEEDVPTPTDSVIARDLNSLEKRTPGCITVGVKP
ncbi:hypothetical protein B9Z19DRAFT_1132206 [Tuber borchii]|uniref:Uncharacterized protein n=1 Tax=Tuber borchii TaxID=42251 RepID=A0A2T6ZHJ5_TUBBO|nr:hypothetical protein B9Z19DRAFT_1132206 [Tuber borchii]